MGQTVLGWLSISRREPSVCSKRGGVPGATASTPNLTDARSTRYSESVWRSAGSLRVRLGGTDGKSFDHNQRGQLET